eukprot:TRINITY_DN2779_c0_g1_i1.p1 TRINITY_DN2779_c0_g1~~TRINITY_DN2779_c0_g1_i1.p1  ORF type:complete len:297 (-),score=66.34 TRINITY_DN2779_c0_g1_i1:184-1074(-)
MLITFKASIAVGSWNINYKSDKTTFDNKHDFASIRIKSLVKQIAKADLFVIQEIHPGSTGLCDEILRQLHWSEPDHRWDYRVSGELCRTQPKREAVAVFARTRWLKFKDECAKVVNFKSKTPLDLATAAAATEASGSLFIDDSSNDRGGWYLELDDTTTGTTFYLLGLHLASGNVPRRSAQVETFVRALCSKLQDEPGEGVALIVGDFNYAVEDDLTSEGGFLHTKLPKFLKKFKFEQDLGLINTMIFADRLSPYDNIIGIAEYLRIAGSAVRKQKADLLISDHQPIFTAFNFGKK